MFIGQIIMDQDSDRLELDGIDLHCGDCLQALVLDAEHKAVWVNVRLEYAKNRYVLVKNADGAEHLIPYSPAGLFGRMLNSFENYYPEN